MSLSQGDTSVPPFSELADHPSSHHRCHHQVLGCLNVDRRDHQIHQLLVRRELLPLELDDQELSVEDLRIREQDLEHSEDHHPW